MEPATGNSKSAREGRCVCMYSMDKCIYVYMCVHVLDR